MEDLVNLTVDAEHHQLIAVTDIGPVFPSRDEYRIDGRSAIHAPRRLLAVRSCQLDTGQTEGAARIVSIVTYAAGREATHRRTVSSNCEDVCGDRCPAVPGKRAGRR